MAETKTHIPSGVNQDCPAGYQFDQESGLCFPQKTQMDFEGVEVKGEIIKPSVTLIQEHQKAELACDEYLEESEDLKKWKRCIKDRYQVKNNFSVSFGGGEIGVSAEATQMTDVDRLNYGRSQLVLDQFAFGVSPINFGLGATIQSEKNPTSFDVFAYGKLTFNTGHNLDYKMSLGTKLAARRLIGYGSQSLGFSVLGGAFTIVDPYGMTYSPDADKSGFEYGAAMDFLWLKKDDLIRTVEGIGPEFRLTSNTFGDRTIGISLKGYYGY